MPKEKVIVLRVEEDLKKKAKKAAESDGRSLSNWITTLIKKEIKRSRSK